MLGLTAATSWDSGLPRSSCSIPHLKQFQIPCSSWASAQRWLITMSACSGGMHLRHSLVLLAASKTCQWVCNRVRQDHLGSPACGYKTVGCRSLPRGPAETGEQQQHGCMPMGSNHGAPAPACYRLDAGMVEVPCQVLQLLLGAILAGEVVQLLWQVALQETLRQHHWLKPHERSPCWECWQQVCYKL